MFAGRAHDDSQPSSRVQLSRTKTTFTWATAGCGQMWDVIYGISFTRDLLFCMFQYQVLSDADMANKC